MIHTHDTPALTQHNLQVMRILLAAQRGHASEVRWLYLFWIYQATFHLRDNLLCHDEYITLLERQLLCSQCRVDGETQVTTWVDLAYACDRYDAQFRVHKPPVVWSAEGLLPPPPIQNRTCNFHRIRLLSVWSLVIDTCTALNFAMCTRSSAVFASWQCEW